MDQSVKPESKSFRPRGFAAMTVERRREIASMGGVASHAKGTAHQFSTQEAIAAGKKRGRLAKQTSEQSNYPSDN